MNNDDIKLRVGLQDQISKGLQDIAKEISSLAKEVKGVQPAAQAASSSIGSMATSFTIATLAAQGIIKGFQLLKTEVQNTIQASNEYTAAMMGLSSVAAAFGQDQNAARDAAKSLASDGLMTVAESASGLKNLLASGFGLEEAINLMNGFKDSAAFNRQASLGFGEAIKGATEGIKNQNSILVDNVGITKNLSVILQQQGLTVQDLQRVQSDASVRQKLYNGLLQEAAVFSGDAARAASTLQGSQSQLNTSVTMLNANIGQALSPALMLIVQEMTGATNAANSGLIPMMNQLSKWLVVVAEGALMLGEAFRSAFSIVGQMGLNLAKAFMSIKSGDFSAAGDAFKKLVVDVGKGVDQFGENVGQIYGAGQKVINKITMDGLGSFNVNAKQMVQGVGNAVSEGAAKVKEALEKENRDYAEKVGDMTKTFNDSLRDMVVSHKGHMQELQKQADDENSNFSKLMADRTKLIEKETQSMQDAIEEVNNKYKDSLIQFKKAGEERLSSLQVQLDREKAQGKLSNSAKVRSLEDMITREKKSLEDQETVKKDLIQKEIDQVVATHEERISELQAETADMQAEHDKRIGALQAEINTEKAIQAKYADDFAKFKDAVALDDITRLKQNYEAQRAEQEREHQERLQDIARRVQEERATASAGQVKTSGVAKSSNTTAATSSSNSFTSLGQISSKASTSAFGISPAVSSLYWSPTVKKYADGGIVDSPTFAQIGENGREAVIPLSKPRRAAQILSQAGLSTGHGVTINAPITVVSSEIDIDMLVERLAYKFGGSSLL